MLITTDMGGDVVVASKSILSHIARRVQVQRREGRRVVAVIAREASRIRRHANRRRVRAVRWLGLDAHGRIATTLIVPAPAALVAMSASTALPTTSALSLALVTLALPAARILLARRGLLIALLLPVLISVWRGTVPATPASATSATPAAIVRRRRAPTVRHFDRPILLDRVKVQRVFHSFGVFVLMLVRWR